MTTTPMTPDELLADGLCPAGCGREIKLGMLLCRHCWYRVPLDLRREVNASWEARKDAFGEDRRPARDRHEAAKAAAIASVA